MRGDTGYAYLPAGQAEVEFAKYEQRVKALEHQCAGLAAQVDRMRPVVDSAMRSADYYASCPDSLTGYEIDLRDRVQAYRKQLAALAKGSNDE